MQQELHKIRKIVLETAPKAVESIAYATTANKIKDKAFVYCAIYKNHIGLYATPTAQVALKAELSPFKLGKSSVQSPLSAPMSYNLIARILAFRRGENLKK